MNTLRICLVASVVGASQLMLATAAADTVAPAANYTCATDLELVPSTAVVGLTLTPPVGGVHPGVPVSLEGTLRIAFDSTFASESQLELASHLGLGNSKFTVTAKVGKRSFALTASSVSGAPTPITNPLVLTADITFPAVTVPADAVGEVSVFLPTSETVSSQVAGAPDKVAFTSVLAQDSLLFPQRNLSCWWTQKAPAQAAATLPITPIPGSSPATTSPGSAASTPVLPPGPAAVTDLPGATGAELPPPSLAPPAAVPASSTSAQPANGAALSKASATVPPNTVGQGTFVPGWLIALAIALVAGSAVAYATNQHRQLVRLTFRSKHTPASRRRL